MNLFNKLAMQGVKLVPVNVERTQVHLHDNCPCSHHLKMVADAKVGQLSCLEIEGYLVNHVQYRLNTMILAVFKSINFELNVLPYHWQIQRGHCWCMPPRGPDSFVLTYNFFET